MLTIGVGNDNASEDDVNDDDEPDKEDTNEPEDNHEEIMASKAKLSAVPKATPVKKPPTKVAPLAAKKPTIALYSLDVHDAAVIAYYNDEEIAYAEVKVHVNGVIPPGMSYFVLAEDGMSVSWKLLKGAPPWCDAWQVLHKPQPHHCLLQCGAGNEA